MECKVRARVFATKNSTSPTDQSIDNWKLDDLRAKIIQGVSVQT